jgi:Fe2+ transport system protein FeoA
MALTSLNAGQAGRLVRIEKGSRNRLRLMEMGLIAGTEITLVRFAPLGDPVELRIGDYHLSVRKEEAQFIQVELL